MRKFGVVVAITVLALQGSSAIAGPSFDVMHAAQDKVLKGLDHDASCSCLGDGNEIAKLGNAVVKVENNAVHDVLHGPGEHNDIVGRKGWMRQRLGF